METLPLTLTVPPDASGSSDGGTRPSPEGGVVFVDSASPLTSELDTAEDLVGLVTEEKGVVGRGDWLRVVRRRKRGTGTEDGCKERKGEGHRKK